MNRKSAPWALALMLCVYHGVAGAGGGNYRTHCQGANEVSPVDSRGQCQANFKQVDGALKYQLIVANIDFVTQAHIHVGSAGTNGAVVAFLFGFVPEGVIVNGVLAEGFITADDLRGPLAGQSIADLVAAIEAGNAYVNVHTLDHPSGEVRGQIH